MSVEPSVDRPELNERWSSLSVDAEYPLQVKKRIGDAEQLGCSDMRSKRSIWQNDSLGRQTEKAKGTHRSLSAPSDVKPRQQLRLPSFKPLGISQLYPDALLTPPDEASLIHWTPSPLGMSDPPTSQTASEPTGMVSRATRPEASVLSGSIAEENTNTPTSVPAVPAIAVHKDEKGDEGSASGSDEAPEAPSWIESARQAIGTLRLRG